MTARHAVENARGKLKMSRGLRLLLAVLCGVSVANIYYAQPLLGQIARIFPFLRPASVS